MDTTDKAANAAVVAILRSVVALDESEGGETLFSLAELIPSVSPHPLLTAEQLGAALVAAAGSATSPLPDPVYLAQGRGEAPANDEVCSDCGQPVERGKDGANTEGRPPMSGHLQSALRRAAYLREYTGEIDEIEELDTLLVDLRALADATSPALPDRSAIVTVLTSTPIVGAPEPSRPLSDTEANDVADLLLLGEVREARAPGQEDPNDDLPDGVLFHGPTDLAQRIVTALSQPRPQVRKARKLGRVLMDALHGAYGPTDLDPTHLAQECGEAPDLDPANPRDQKIIADVRRAHERTDRHERGAW